MYELPAIGRILRCTTPAALASRPCEPGHSVAFGSVGVRLGMPVRGCSSPADVRWESRTTQDQGRCRSWSARARGPNAPDPISRPCRPLRLSVRRYATDRDLTREMPLVVPRDQRNHFLPPVMTTVFPSGYDERGFRLQPRHLEYILYRLAILVNPSPGPCILSILDTRWLCETGLWIGFQGGGAWPARALTDTTCVALTAAPTGPPRTAIPGANRPTAAVTAITASLRRAIAITTQRPSNLKP